MITPTGRDDDLVHDDVTSARYCIREHARDLAGFADVISTLISMEQDFRAHAMFGALEEEVRSLTNHFAKLDRGLKARAREDLPTMRNRANLAMEQAERLRREVWEEADRQRQEKEAQQAAEDADARS